MTDSPETSPDPAQRWWPTVAASPFAWFHVDRAGVLQQVGGAVLRELGLEAAALTGRGLVELYPGNPHVAALVAAVREGTPPPPVIDVEQRVWEVFYTPAPDGDGVLGLALDVTRRQRADEVARRRHEFERLLIRIATELITVSAAELPGRVDQILAAVGRFAGVDRAFVFERDADVHPEHGLTMSETYEWCAPGVHSVFDAYQRVPDAAVQWYLDWMQRGEDFVYPRRDVEFPVTDQERTVYEAEGVQALICVPLRPRGELQGFLGLVSLQVPRQWSSEERSLLHAAADTLARTIDREHLARELAQQRAFEELVASLGAEFINLPVVDTDRGINAALRRIGEFAGVDRTYVFEFDLSRRTLSNTYEWTRAEVPPAIDRAQDLPFDAFGWAVPPLLDGQEVVVPDVAAMPVAAAAERAEFEAQGIRSLICVPMRRAGRTVGFIGADAVQRPRDWTASEIRYLRLAAEMFQHTLERRRAEHDRQALEQQVRQAQKLESLGVLAGGIAHDFNNLLTTMLGNASLALEDLSPTAPARYSIDQVRIAAERARDLTNQMLAYAGRGRVIVESLDLSTAVQEMGELLRVSVGRRARLDFALAPDLPAIAADVTQLRQVIMNLLTNAAEALPESGGTVTVQTGVDELAEAELDGRWVPEDPPPGRYVWLSVRDTGSGMDTATQARIFDPFFSTKFAGRGLGLAAVLGIAQGHGGALRVESTPGTGTEIRVIWPATHARAAEPVAESEAASPARGAGTVLVIDDEDGVRLVTRNALERAGYTVLTAPSGRQGADLLREHRAAVVAIVLDLEMPDLDGVGTFGLLQAIAPDVPVILSSGYTERDALSRFGDAGLRGFLQKPYTAARLRDAVHRVTTPD